MAHEHEYSHIDFSRYEVSKNDPVVQQYEKNGYPSKMDTVEEALRVMKRMSDSEKLGQEIIRQKFNNQDIQRTMSEHFWIIPAIIEKYKNPIQLIKIPVTELVHIRHHAADRMEVVRDKLQKIADIPTLPLPVITLYEGSWYTFDGQTRISRMKELGVTDVYAYYVDFNQYNDDQLEYEKYRDQLTKPEKGVLKQVKNFFRRRFNI